MNNPLEIVVGVQFLFLLVGCILLGFILAKKRFYEKKYSAIIDLDAEVKKTRKTKDQVDDELKELRASYKTKKLIFDGLIKQAAIYNEEIELAELGFYSPHFDFDASEEYKKQIEGVRYRQKQMVSNKEAVFCRQEWTLDGSKAKGRTLTNRAIRLTARAFNNECDAAISNIRWNNMDRMEQRIQKAFKAINKLNESNQIVIGYDYLRLKIDELRLSHEYKEKRQQEKEEQSEIRRKMREELQLENETEKAVKEEEKYKKLLSKATLEAEKVSGVKLVKLQEKVDALNQKLIIAHTKSERAKSMAQKTKAGHVYIISNIGSFGENIYKVGMTRRLEPLDRVKELGDASVPFIFDVHAMIYSDDAPALERAIHKEFDRNRVNLVNNRKEFFQVSLDDIEEEAKKIFPDVEFIRTVEARQYKESEAIRAQRNKQSVNMFPDSI